jgi:CBS domain-containing protein
VEVPGIGDAPAPLAAGALQTGVEAILTPGVACVRASDPIATVRHLLVERRVGAVPVLDADGRPIGIITGGDLLRAHEERGERPAATAGDVMTCFAFALPVTASVAQAAALIAYEGVKIIVITDLDGEVAGLVSAVDIARWCARGAGYLVDREHEDEEAA